MNIEVKAELIAKAHVLREHATWVECLGCGWRRDFPGTTNWGVWFPQINRAHAAYIALAEVARFRGAAMSGFKISFYDSCVANGLLRRDIAEEKAQKTLVAGGKVCTKCQTWRPINEFYRCSKVIDSLNSWCKECFRAYFRSNHVWRMEQQREYRRKKRTQW